MTCTSRLKGRAAAERMSHSDYVARELTHAVQYRSNAEILREARERLPGTDRPTLRQALDASRDGR